MCSQSQKCCWIPDKYIEILERRHRSSGNLSALRLGEPLSHAHPVMGPLDHVPWLALICVCLLAPKKNLCEYAGLQPSKGCLLGQNPEQSLQNYSFPSVQKARSKGCPMLFPESIMVLSRRSLGSGSSIHLEGPRNVKCRLRQKKSWWFGEGVWFHNHTRWETSKPGWGQEEDLASI